MNHDSRFTSKLRSNLRDWPYRLTVRTRAFSAGGGSSFGGQATNMYYLYVLKNQDAARHYIGITEDLKKRLVKHNSGSVRSTKAYKPWKMIHNEQFQKKTDARVREIFLKRTARARRELFDKIDKHGPIV